LTLPVSHQIKERGPRHDYNAGKQLKRSADFVGVLTFEIKTLECDTLTESKDERPQPELDLKYYMSVSGLPVRCSCEQGVLSIIEHLAAVRHEEDIATSLQPCKLREVRGVLIMLVENFSVNSVWETGRRSFFIGDSCQSKK
jgi:hypothetical protein